MAVVLRGLDPGARAAAPSISAAFWKSQVVGHISSTGSPCGVTGAEAAQPSMCSSRGIPVPALGVRLVRPLSGGQASYVLVLESGLSRSRQHPLEPIVARPLSPPGGCFRVFSGPTQGTSRLGCDPGMIAPLGRTSTGEAPRTDGTGVPLPWRLLRPARAGDPEAGTLGSPVSAPLLTMDKGGRREESQLLGQNVLLEEKLTRRGRGER